MKEADTLVCLEDANFLEEIIKTESIFYERLFLKENFRKEVGMNILKINLLKYFYGFKMPDEEENGWSGNLWYSYDLLGGQIYELRNKGISDNEICKQILKGKYDFLKSMDYCDNYPNILMHHHCHEIYDTMVKVLERKIIELQN